MVHNNPYYWGKQSQKIKVKWWKNIKISTLQKDGQRTGDTNSGSKLHIMRCNSLFLHQHPTQQKGDKHTQKPGVYLHVLMSLFLHFRQGERQMEAPATLVLPLPGLTGSGASQPRYLQPGRACSTMAGPEPAAVPPARSGFLPYPIASCLAKAQVR